MADSYGGFQSLQFDGKPIVPKDWKWQPGVEIDINEHGGAQSKIDGRYDMIPGEALTTLAQVFGLGATRYARNNWRRIPFEDHINHALNHLSLLLSDASDKDEDHLAHALCRLAMAVAKRDPEAPFSFKEVGPPIQK